MGLRIYNVLTRNKEIFNSIESGVVSMYVCGPTVYDSAHMGHAMSALVFDMIRRYLEYSGYRVRHVMNYTDVDDKIINRANDLNIDPTELAETYIAEFDDNLRSLNILPAMNYPRATDMIPDMIKFIERLIKSHYAYCTEDGSVYFRVGRSSTYGQLSGRGLKDMVSGERAVADLHKISPMDFALWKAAKPGEPTWDSPWGAGRPGWHIECSTMVRELLGDQIDIHGGGNDLLFPHHENELAQSEALTGKPMARFWVHNGMLQLRGEKMSKSTGNMLFVKDFLVRNEPDVLRLLVLNSHYRSPLAFNDDIVEQSRKGVERLRGALRPVSGNVQRSEVTIELQQEIDRARQGFIEAMDDDFNTPAALGYLYNLARAINRARDDSASVSEAQSTLRELTGILGLELRLELNDSHKAKPYIDLLITVRKELRRHKEWALSDLIRNQLIELGVVVEDDGDDTTWRFHR